MSRKGNCWDNAVAESFFATLKNEEATGVYETRAAAHAAIASYIHGFYNPTPLHSALGYPQRLCQDTEASRVTRCFWRPFLGHRFNLPRMPETAMRWGLIDHIVLTPGERRSEVQAQLYFHLQALLALAHDSGRQRPEAAAGFSGQPLSLTVNSRVRVVRAARAVVTRASRPPATTAHPQAARWNRASPACTSSPGGCRGWAGRRGVGGSRRAAAPPPRGPSR